MANIWQYIEKLKKDKRIKADNISFFSFFERGFANTRLQQQLNAAFQFRFILNKKIGVKHDVPIGLEWKRQKR